MRSKIRLLFTRLDGIDDARLDRALQDEATRLETGFDPPIEIRRAFAVPDADLHRVAAGAFDAAERPFDAMLEAIVPNGRLGEVAALLDGLAERVAGLVDPAASAALAGTEHVIIPGTGGLFVLINNRRLPGFTHQGFIDYWLDYHGPFARAHVPPDYGMAYRQFHTDPALTADLLRHTGLAIGDFDGAAECFYRDAATIREMMGRTEVVDEATEDEKKFVDHDRCVTCLFAVPAESEVPPAMEWAGSD